MRARIFYERLDIATQKGAMPTTPTAWYVDERGKKGPVAKGATTEQAIEALYQQLGQRGYKRSELPNPEPAR